MYFVIVVIADVQVMYSWVYKLYYVIFTNRLKLLDVFTYCI